MESVVRCRSGQVETGLGVLWWPKFNGVNQGYVMTYEHEMIIGFYLLHRIKCAIIVGKSTRKRQLYLLLHQMCY